MSGFTSLIGPLSSIQNRLMTDTCRVLRNGSVVTNAIACRVHKDRLFTEPADPQDANFRSTQEWGFTMPTGTDVRIGDEVQLQAHSISAIIGEVLYHDTWQTALRVWGTEPKLATPTIPVVLWRYNPTLDDWEGMTAQNVQIIYDRNQPEESPVRYVPAGRAVYKHGALIGGLDFDVKIGDRFTIDGFSASITMLLPEQPQHIEARFRMDLSGDRIG